MTRKYLHETTSLHESPCIGVCTTTQWGDSICRGCGRTSDEVRDWGTFTEIEKKLIVIRCWKEYLPLQKRGIIKDFNNS
jgi:predicted Fe-S protein YdhL (DUF1289 family)|tara:strand:+ start:5438 stop:5674 length:237 start_codon:yes stop_codon:yes gene_type:complete